MKMLITKEPYHESSFVVILFIYPGHLISIFYCNYNATDNALHGNFTFPEKYLSLLPDHSKRNDLFEGVPAMLNILIIGLGGFFGAISRYVIGSWIAQRWGHEFPVGTFVVNISGCFFIGLAMSLLVERMILSPQWRLFMVIGFLGAYTTFSTFEYETGSLLKDGEILYALFNITLSVVVGFIALKLGDVLGKLL